MPLKSAIECESQDFIRKPEIDDPNDPAGYGLESGAIWTFMVREKDSKCEIVTGKDRLKTLIIIKMITIIIRVIIIRI